MSVRYVHYFFLNSNGLGSIVPGNMRYLWQFASLTYSVLQSLIGQTLPDKTAPSQKWHYYLRCRL